MTDKEFAEEFILRLNKLCEDTSVLKLVEKMIGTRFEARHLEDHPKIQVIGGHIGFLGIINGVIGTIPSGPKKDWGYISAYYMDSQHPQHPDFPDYLHKFVLTKPTV